MQQETNKQLKLGDYNTTFGVYTLLESLPVPDTTFYRMFDKTEGEVKYLDMLHIHGLVAEEGDGGGESYSTPYEAGAESPAGTDTTGAHAKAVKKKKEKEKKTKIKEDQFIDENSGDTYTINSGCNVYLKNTTDAYPRTCSVCGLGPCKFKVSGTGVGDGVN